MAQTAAIDPLLLAAWTGDVEAARKALAGLPARLPPQTNLREITPLCDVPRAATGETALQLAIRLGHLHVAAVLLEAGALVRGRAVHNGSTVMQVVALCGDAPVVLDLTKAFGAAEAEARRVAALARTPLPPLDRDLLALPQGPARYALGCACVALMERQLELALVARLPRLREALLASKDFTARVSFKFSSSIPLVSRFLPSDEVVIRKRGARVRLDCTLAGMKGLRFRRGNLSFIADLSDREVVAAAAISGSVEAASAAADPAAAPAAASATDAAAARLAASMSRRLVVLDHAGKRWADIGSDSALTRGGGYDSDDDEDSEEEEEEEAAVAAIKSAKGKGAKTGGGSAGGKAATTDAAATTAVAATATVPEEAAGSAAGEGGLPVALPDDTRPPRSDSSIGAPHVSASVALALTALRASPSPDLDVQTGGVIFVPMSEPGMVGKAVDAVFGAFKGLLTGSGSSSGPMVGSYPVQRYQMKGFKLTLRTMPPAAPELEDELKKELEIEDEDEGDDEEGDDKEGGEGEGAEGKAGEAEAESASEGKAAGPEEGPDGDEEDDVTAFLAASRQLEAAAAKKKKEAGARGGAGEGGAAAAAAAASDASEDAGADTPWKLVQVNRLFEGPLTVPARGAAASVKLRLPALPPTSSSTLVRVLRWAVRGQADDDSKAASTPDALAAAAAIAAPEAEAAQVSTAAGQPRTVATAPGSFTIKASLVPASSSQSAGSASDALAVGGRELWSGAEVSLHAGSAALGGGGAKAVEEDVLLEVTNPGAWWYSKPVGVSLYVDVWKQRGEGSTSDDEDEGAAEASSRGGRLPGSLTMPLGPALAEDARMPSLARHLSSGARVHALGWREVMGASAPAPSSVSAATPPPDSQPALFRAPPITRISKTLSAKVAFAPAFPLTVADFLPVAAVLARTGTHFRNFESFLQARMPPGAGFPVQFDIPLLPVITMHVEFQGIETHPAADREAVAAMFTVPSDYADASRDLKKNRFFRKSGAGGKAATA